MPCSLESALNNFPLLRDRKHSKKTSWIKGVGRTPGKDTREGHKSQSQSPGSCREQSCLRTEGRNNSKVETSRADSGHWTITQELPD